MQLQYHITRDDPIEPNWPKGAWSVYRINGDQIADRIVRESVNPNGYYEGKVIARHSWCGYLGTTETFEGVQKIIEGDRADQEAQAARDKKRAATAA